MSDLQNTFLSAVIHESVVSAFDEKALAAYRNNLYASAIRSLEISYPTLYQLCGHEFFQELAIRYVKAHPFAEGDWGEWGGDLPSFMESSGVDENYPYFPSVARLDWILHLTERAADPQQNAESFQLLGSERAADCKLVISPLVAFLESDFPIVDIFLAHHPDENSQQFIARAKEKIAKQEGQVALVYRPIFKASVEVCEDENRSVISRFKDGKTVGETFNALPDGFDFERWLSKSVERKIVLGAFL